MVGPLVNGADIGHTGNYATLRIDVEYVCGLGPVVFLPHTCGNEFDSGFTGLCVPSKASGSVGNCSHGGPACVDSDQRGYSQRISFDMVDRSR